MKKIVSILAMVAAVLAACNKNDKATKTVSLTVTVDAGEISGITLPETFVVTLTNVSTSASERVETENGVAFKEGLLPGIYNILVSGTAADAGYTYLFSGSANSVSVLEDTELDVKVSIQREAALVFKEVYHTGLAYGQTDPDNVWSGTTYFRDQFYEIYNNSTETVYLDGLVLTCNGAGLSYASYDYSTIYEYDIPEADKYLFVYYGFQFPGSGTEYPLQPGESAVVAQWATKHTAENLANGHSLDLSGAEFEALFAIGGYANITDNDAVNLNLVFNSYYSLPQWLNSVDNGTIILYKPTHSSVENDNFIGCVNGTLGAREVYLDDIIDAVQWKPTLADATTPGYLHLPSSIDAGYSVESMYSGTSMVRKVAYTREDGTAVYQDTNNSVNDFTVERAPVAHRNGAKVPSWTTWAK